MKRIAIVGGGIAGLAAAWEIERQCGNAEPGPSAATASEVPPQATAATTSGRYARNSPSAPIEILLFEKCDFPGGKIRSEMQNGFVLDAGPDGFLARKEAGITLCTEIGITDRLIGQSPLPKGEAHRSYIRREHTLHPLPQGFSGLVPLDLDGLRNTSLLTDAGRARAAREREIPAGTDTADESIAAFFTRRYGREAFDRMIEPLVSGIYAGDADRLGILATFPQLRRAEAGSGSLTVGLVGSAGPNAIDGARRTGPGGQGAVPGAGSPFVSFPEGAGALPAAVAAALTHTRLITKAEITSLAFDSGLFKISTSTGERYDADGIILATPAPEAARLLHASNPHAARLLHAIEYATSTIVYLAFHATDLAHVRAGYGYVIPAKEADRFRACTITSRKWAGRAPEGFELVRLFARDAGPAGGGDDLIRAACGELRATLGVDAKPVSAWVHRLSQSIPQYEIGHARRMDEVDALMDDMRSSGIPIALCGAAYRGVGIPDCIASGRAAAREVFKRLRE